MIPNYSLDQWLAFPLYLGLWRDFSPIFNFRLQTLQICRHFFRTYNIVFNISKFEVKCGDPWKSTKLLVFFLWNKLFRRCYYYFLCYFLLYLQKIVCLENYWKLYCYSLFQSFRWTDVFISFEKFSAQVGKRPRLLIFI